MGFSLGGFVSGLSNGLTLANQFQDAQDRKQARAEAQAERDRINEANAAGAEALKKREEVWRAANAQAVPGTEAPAGQDGQEGTAVMPVNAAASKPWTPGRDDYLAAYEARGTALAKAGDWKNFAQNEATVSPLRIQARNEAIDQASARFAVDGDVEALAKSVYPRVYDGREIASVERTAAEEGGPKREAKPESFIFKFDDGTSSRPLTRDDIIGQVKTIRANPEDVAKFEFASRLQRARSAYEAQRQIEVEKAKEEAAGRLEDVKHKNRVTEDDRNNAAALTRTKTSAGATVEAARIRAEADALDDQRKGGLALLDNERKRIASEKDDLRADEKADRDALGDFPKKSDVAAIEVARGGALKDYLPSESSASSGKSPGRGGTLADVQPQSDEFKGFRIIK